MINQPEAFSLTPSIKDCGHSLFKCAICDKEARFAFIGQSRKKGGRDILVGIDCAKKLHNPMAIEQKISPTIWISDNKNNLILESKKKRLISVLLNLREKEPGFNFNNMLEKTSSNLSLSPAQASLVISLSKKNSIILSTDLIKVSIRSTAEKNQVKNMTDWQVSILIETLSPRQEKAVKRLRTQNNKSTDKPLTR